MVGRGRDSSANLTPIVKCFLLSNSVFVVPDHSKGFGGKYGVQADRVDQSALGWDHKEDNVKHESQKGMIYILTSTAYIAHGRDFQVI